MLTFDRLSCRQTSSMQTHFKIMKGNQMKKKTLHSSVLSATSISTTC